MVSSTDPSPADVTQLASASLKVGSVNDSVPDASSSCQSRVVSALERTPGCISCSPGTGHPGSLATQSATSQRDVCSTADAGSLVDTVCVHPAVPPDHVRDAVCGVREAARMHRRAKAQDCQARCGAIRPKLSSEQRLLLDVAGEKGVSSWVMATPGWQSGTILNKADFRDALCIRYGMSLPGLPDRCVCGMPMSTAHAFTCPTGGYPTARHNEVRDLLAGIISEAGLSDVEVEPRGSCP